MYTLLISKSTPTRVQIKITKDGQPYRSYAMSANSLPAQKTLAKELGVRISDITPHLDKAMDEEFATASFGTIESNAFSILIRGIASPLHTAEKITDEDPFKCIVKALHTTGFCQAEPILKWDDPEQLCVVDIDYHSIPHDRRPSWNQLMLVASMIKPTPVVYHASHGQGVKLYYVATEGFTANEIAAAGAMAWLAADGRATAELKTETRHPAYGRYEGEKCYTIPATAQPVVMDVQRLVLTEIARWGTKNADQEVIEEWLSQHNLIQGKRYEHTRCLIDSDTPSHGEPVFIGDAGIFCQRCAAVGNTYGSRRTPGFVPYSALPEISGMDSEVYNMAFKKTHWAHAKYVLLHNFRLGESILRLAYSCALKMLHKPNNPIIAKCFLTQSIARVGHKWVFTDDPNLTALDKSAKAIIAELPATWDVYSTENDTYTVKPNAAKIEALAHTGRSLAEHGYTNLTPIHGMQMWGRRLPYVAGTTPLPPSFLHLPGECRPKYIPKAKRTPALVEAAWGVLEDVFPEIDRRFVRLLLATRGITESGGNNVFICCAGPSGAGKSTSVAVVAGLCGDTSTDIPFNKDSARFRQGVIEGLSVGSYITVDEIFKNAAIDRISPRQAMDTILTMTPKSKSHQMYVGPVTMPACGVFVFTDIEVPQDIRDDVQLARRIIYIKLSGRVDWRTSMNRVGLDKPENFRLLSVEHAFAADIICSEACDEFFSTVNTLDELVSWCSVGFLEKSTDFSDITDLYRQFFNLLCDSPPLAEEDAKRVSGEDFHRISLADSTDLRDVWDQLADGLSGTAWKNSRKISSVDWTKLLTTWFPDANIPKGVTVDIRCYKDSTIYVRFRLGTFEAPFATNRGILTWRPLTPPVESTPEVSG